MFTVCVCVQGVFVHCVCVCASVFVHSVRVYTGCVCTVSVCVLCVWVMVHCVFLFVCGCVGVQGLYLCAGGVCLH